MLYFGFHQGEGSNEVATVQVHADAENMGFHVPLADEHIRDAMDQFLDVTNMRIQIYGTPTDPILDQIRALSRARVCRSPSTGQQEPPCASPREAPRGR